MPRVRSVLIDASVNYEQGGEVFLWHDPAPTLQLAIVEAEERRDLQTRAGHASRSPPAGQGRWQTLAGQATSQRCVCS